MTAPKRLAILGSTGSIGTQTLDVVGQFRDELQRTPDGWLFAHRTFTIIGTHVTEKRP